MRMRPAPGVHDPDLFDITRIRAPRDGVISRQTCDRSDGEGLFRPCDVNINMAGIIGNGN